MGKQIVSTPKAPGAIGPYSQAVVAGTFVFTAGQIGIDPASGSLVDGGITEQTRQVLENVKAILEASGSGLTDVVKTTVYLKDMAEFGAMNEVYRQFFPDSPPARSTVEVARLPRDVRVEIEAVALTKK